MIAGMWDWRYLSAMLALLTIYSGFILFAVKFLMRKQSGDLADKLMELIARDTGQDDEIEAVRREISEHRIEVAKDYIRREDALVYFSRFEQKLDAVWGFLHERFNNRG